MADGNKQRIRIRLKAYDHEILDQSTKKNSAVAITMANTMAVVTAVSLRVGQVTRPTS